MGYARVGGCLPSANDLSNNNLRFVQLHWIMVVVFCGCISSSIYSLYDTRYAIGSLGPQRTADEAGLVAATLATHEVMWHMSQHPYEPNIHSAGCKALYYLLRAELQAKPKYVELRHTKCARTRTRTYAVTHVNNKNPECILSCDVFDLM